MKKRILALVCAMVMTLAASMTVAAAESPSAGGSVTTETVSPSDYIPAENLTTGSGQKLSEDTVADMAKNTKVVSGNVKVSEAWLVGAASAVTQAKKVVGDNAFIATVVDLEGEAGEVTLACPNVFAGQKVVVLHEIKEGKWETIKPTKVENGKVTFNAPSFSLYAVVVDTTASKTADMAVATSVMALIGLAGTAVCGKKVKED